MTQTFPTLPPCEVVILTALPVECEAVLRFLHQLQEIVHRSGTIYSYGTFAGNHRTWQVAVAEIGMGGVRAAVEAERAISFFQAQIALFVGVAGGLKDVQQGDVVVATKIYAYESGKAKLHFEPRPEVEHPGYALEQRARAEAHHDEWLARLGGSVPERAPQVLIGAVASGEKVLASKRSSLARLLTTTYGDALAVEMEGYGFLHAVRVNHLVSGLVIRGISDLIDDKREADASGGQRLAAQHAAAFAFQVLAKFTPSAQSPPPSPMPPAIWNVPYIRNPFFTGREDLLERLHTHLRTTQAAALSQPQAISGLGGVGKTQLAIEYAHRYGQEYQAVLWVRAETTEALNASYTEMAGLLQVLQKGAQEQDVIVQAVRGWLSSTSNWLLILDNADDLTLVPAFLPTRRAGHLLLTTRAQIIGKVAQRFEVDALGAEMGALLLLRRAGVIPQDGALEAASPSDRAVAMVLTKELGGLPLALDQAGAYIEETQCSLADYEQSYQTRRAELLARRGGIVEDHPEPVTTTWSLSFTSVEQASPLAAAVLQACAFLAPDAIPEVLLMEVLKTPVSASDKAETEQEEGIGFSSLATGQFDEALAVLRAYSLLQRNAKQHTLSIHRLVQAVLLDAMNEQEQQAWAQRIVRVLSSNLPEFTFTHWNECEQYVPHMQACLPLVGGNGGVERARVCSWLGAYLLERHRTQEAGPYVQQALSWQTAHLGETHPETAASLDSLARWWQLQGKHAEAEPLYAQVLAIREQELGATHPDTASSLNNLALVYQAQGKDAEAEPLLKRALTINEQGLGATHPDTARILSNLAELYRNQGKYAEAEPLFVQALTICEQELGANHPDTATSLNNLALVYQDQGKDAEAEPLLKRALTIREQELGVTHPDTAISLSNLANLYYTQRKYAEAEPLCARARAICEAILGHDHPRTQTIRTNYAALLAIMKKSESPD